MSKIRAVGMGVLASLVLVCPFLSKKAHAAERPVIQAPYAVVINADTGEVLYDKDSHTHAYPASITKLMTVLLLEKYMKNHDKITATPKAVAQDPSNWFYRMHLGEKMSKQDALNALMIISSNDVAMAVAEHIGGSEAGFAKMMNEEAKTLGLKDTHFVTPNGLHNPNHYTSPYDMALIAKEDMKYPEILKAMQTSTYMIHTDEQTAEIYRRDKIYDNPYAFGGKTGFTDQAGQTIVEYEKKGSKRIIAVVMKDNNLGEYPDVKAISDYAFSRMRTLQVGSVSKIYKTIQVNQISLPVYLAKTTSLGYAEGDRIKKVITWMPQQTLEKGVKKRSKVGTLSLFINGKLQKKVDLLAAKTIKAPNPFSPTFEFLSDQKTLVFFSIILLLVAGFFVLKPRNLEKRDQTRV